MFTGIIEALGEVTELKKDGSNLHIKIESKLSNEFKIDQSVSHDGVCLTVTKVDGNAHWVTAVDETIHKTNFGGLAVGKKFNLELPIFLKSAIDKTATRWGPKRKWLALAAAIVAFLELDDDEQADYVRRVNEAEMGFTSYDQLAADIQR